MLAEDAATRDQGAIAPDLQRELEPIGEVHRLI
jgi:hypothetical protein